MEILNPWRSTSIKRFWFTEVNPIYSNGDYNIYRQSQNCYLYTYKNMAFNQLAGLNKQHLNNVANRTGNETDFLYNRALDNLKTCKQLLND